MAFLKRSGLSGIQYDEYLSKFKSAVNFAKELTKVGITPDKESILNLKKNLSPKNLLRNLKKSYLGNFSITFDENRKTFIKNNQRCTDEMPDFSSLPKASRPSYFAGNIIYDALSRRLGRIVPKTNGTAILTVGGIEKTIKWKADCYSQNILAQLSNVFSTCWLCPLYDYFFKAISHLSYSVWKTVRKPMVAIIAVIFLLWFVIKILRMFFGFEEEGIKASFFTKDLLKKLAMLSITALILGAPETGYSIVREFIDLVLTPISELSIYLSKKFLVGKECSYIPMSFDSSKTMFSPEIKNSILCLLEQLLDVFVDYVLLSIVVILKSFGILIDVIIGMAKTVVSTAITAPLGGLGKILSFKTSLAHLKPLWGFIITFLLGMGLFVSFVMQMFKTLFYLVDPIFKMGMIFLWLPFTFLNWIVKIEGIKNISFTEHFKTLITGFVIMIFTALIVSLCGTILLALMSSIDSYEAFQQAVTTKNFADMWTTVDVGETTILRLIAGIIIVHILMKKIPDYAQKFTNINADTKVWNEMKDTFNTAYGKGKTRLYNMKKNFNFFEKMRK